MPGNVADFLRTAELEPAERAALDQGVTVRRGQGYTLHVTAAPAVHHRLLARCQPLDGAPGAPAQVLDVGGGPGAHARRSFVASARWPPVTVFVAPQWGLRPSGPA
ncbi:hypothetical protein AB0Q90_41735 [Streptomyces sp. NPDC079141]|uniref:hypothetical protein n=1 Tax=Streptomyces sp. NPDC079141 TaxID=3155056 RepID=UPI0034188649